MSELNEKKVIIIGGGPAGLTAAYELCRRGIKSTVLEKDTLVGGISKTVDYKGYYFDIGGHRFFTKIKTIDDLWREVLNEDLLKRKRLSRIYYHKKFFHYPLRPINIITGLGLWNSILILSSYINAHFFPNKSEKSFEQWVSNRFGKRLYEIFFKSYTEKIWGMPCNEISSDWAAQRIKGLSFISAVKNALNYEISFNKKTAIRTLIDSFDYPKKGPGMMWEAFSDIVQKRGSTVILGAEVEKIFWNKDKVDSVGVKVSGQQEVIKGTHVISSMPVRELIESFEPGVPEDVLRAARSLNYRDFLTVSLIVNRRDLFKDNWIYIHDPDVKVGRIQNFKNWSPYMVPNQEKTCLGLEYFCFEGDELWTMTDQELIELGKKESEILGLVNASEVEEGIVVRMPKAYPVYDAMYQEALGDIRYFLDKIHNLQLVGRNGMHKYNNQDHSIIMGILAAENILENKDHDLWQINTDYDTYQESSVINETGLVDI